MRHKAIFPAGIFLVSALLGACGSDNNTDDAALIAQGKQTFRYDTFGDESKWTAIELSMAGIPSFKLGIYIGGIFVDKDDNVWISQRPRSVNDRLLLGMKGTMSEMELSLLRQRSAEALKLKTEEHLGEDGERS